jgi:drug/metabolite transporter (DMT)-like permease
MNNWIKAILGSISTLAIVFAGIQLTPFITPASSNKILAFLIPLGALILAAFLQYLKED